MFKNPRLIQATNEPWLPAIAWHDFGGILDVSRVVDQTAGSANDLKVHAIERTRLAVGFKEDLAGDVITREG